MRPGTNFFVVVNSHSCLQRSPGPVAVRVIGYYNNKLGDYDYEIGKEIAARYPNLFGESRSPLCSYHAVEIPSYALDLVTDFFEMERMPMKTATLIQGRSYDVHEPKRISQE